MEELKPCPFFVVAGQRWPEKMREYIRDSMSLAHLLIVIAVWVKDMTVMLVQITVSPLKTKQ